MNVLRTRLAAGLVCLSLQMAGCGSGSNSALDALPCTTSPSPVVWAPVSASAAWTARDSAAEYAHAGKLWLMGGWEDSFAPNPRDVWSSVDGRDWTKVVAQAPWTHGDLAASTVHDGRMWLLGGWANGRLAGAGSSNAVWSSNDGVQWTDHGGAPWDQRMGAGAASHAGRLWLAGGVTRYFDGDASSLRNDVWSSIDGSHWQKATAAAPWSPRAYHQLVSHEGRLYVLGGGNYQPTFQGHADVWSSEDGVAWRIETSSAPWSPRIWFSAVSWKGYLWVLGGWSNDPYRNWGDVWYSRDGRHWARLEAASQWSPRHEHSTYVHDGRLWVAGGFAEPLSNDVWSLTLPTDWLGHCAAQD